MHLFSLIAFAIVILAATKIITNIFEVKTKEQERTVETPKNE